MADHPAVDEDLGAPPGMPRQVLGCAQPDVDAAGAGDHPHRLECVGGLDGAPGTPGSARFPQPGEDRADVHRLMRQGGIEGCDLLVGGPAVGRNQLHRAGTLGRLHDLRDREQRDIDKPTGYVARQRLQQCWQERSGQVRAVGLQRVEHGGRDAPRVVGGQAPLVEHAGGQERGGQHLDIAAEREGLADRAAALLGGGQPATRGRGGQHRGNLVEALQPQHLLDEVGGLHEVRPPAGRGDDEDRRIDAVLVDPRADLGQPVDRRTRLVLDTGHPVGQVEPHPHRGR